MNKLEKAIEIAKYAFNDKKDLSGEPYFKHLERVANSFKGEYDTDEKIVSYLHDLLEDCPEWNDKVLRCFFYKEIVDAVMALTKKKGVNYEEYISNLSENNIASRVKIADLKDNMNITRLKNIGDKDVIRLKKYHKAYQFLTGENLTLQRL